MPCPAYVKHHGEAEPPNNSLAKLAEVSSFSIDSAPCLLHQHGLPFYSLESFVYFSVLAVQTNINPHLRSLAVPTQPANANPTQCLPSDRHTPVTAQLSSYLSQPATREGSMYGRLSVASTAAGTCSSRIPTYCTEAAGALDTFDKTFYQPCRD